MIPCLISLGRTIITINSLKSCSIILEMVWGIICCLPKKYPLMIEAIDINGKTREQASKG